MADVRTTFKRVNLHKAARPDGILNHVLRACACVSVCVRGIITIFKSSDVIIEKMKSLAMAFRLIQPFIFKCYSYSKDSLHVVVFYLCIPLC